MEKIKEGYTRVSEILGQWNHLAHIDPHVLANKCRIGTEVHEKICAEVDGIYIETSEDVQDYVESWRKWTNEQKFFTEILTTEKRFYCEELKITGQVDAIVKCDEGLCVLDYKTSATANPKMWALQAGFYYHLASVNGWDIEPKAIFLQLKKKGAKAKAHIIEITPEIWDRCVGAFQLYRYFNS